MTRAFLLFFALLNAACAPAAQTAQIACERRWTLLAEYPHEPAHFTQGLVLVGGRLLESVGRYGQSALVETERHSGRVLKRQRLPDALFAEGLALAGDRLVQLTWREEVALVYDLDLRYLGHLRYPGEGWGLSTLDAADGPRLVMSDGTPWLRFLRPADLAETHRVQVRDAQGPVPLLNELEMVNGELLANVWHSDRVLAIDPSSGAVNGWYDLSALRRKLAWPGGVEPRETDLNGLAWDGERRRLLVTGKSWPRLFEIEPGGCVAPAASQ